MSYPYIEDNLPRYWNDAHLLPLILKEFHYLIAELLKKPINDENIIERSVNGAFESYETWNNEQNEIEGALAGLDNFNNKQMFWIAFTHKKCSKLKTFHLGNYYVGYYDYVGSANEMFRTFGCRFEPTYLDNDRLFRPRNQIFFVKKDFDYLNLIEY